MFLDQGSVMELLMALTAGGVLTVVIKSFVDRKKSNAEAKKLSVESEGYLSDLALRMADRLQHSMTAMEAKVDTLVKEIDLLKRRNNELDETCRLLSSENVELKAALEKCIKKD